MRACSTDGQTSGWADGNPKAHTQKRPPAWCRCLATPAFIKKHTFVSQQGAHGRWTSFRGCGEGFPCWNIISKCWLPSQFLSFHCKLQCLCCYRNHNSRVKGGVGWWTHWLISSALISGVGEGTDALINSKGSSPDLAVDVCQACISPAHGPPPCRQRAFVSERRLHRCASLPDEEGQKNATAVPQVQSGAFWLQRGRGHRSSPRSSRVISFFHFFLFKVLLLGQAVFFGMLLFFPDVWGLFAGSLLNAWT